MLNQLQRAFWRGLITAALFPFINIEVEGKSNLPQEGEMPLIIICNHFSYWDPLIMMSRIPRRARFLAAVEMTRIFFFSHLLNVFEGIPVWRGQVDRKAIRTTLNHLKNNGIIGIFPEGGIIPELQEMVARGEKIVNVPNTKSRNPARLAAARPGTSYIATASQAHILPISIIGSNEIEANLKRFPWKRTHVKITIGQTFGPLQVESSLRGKAKRARLDELSNVMMSQIAELMPIDQRGPYTDGAIIEAPAASPEPTLA